MKAITIRIDDDLHEWLTSNFPHGFKQMFLEQCLKSLRLLITRGKMDSTLAQAHKATIHTLHESTKEDG